MPVGVAEVAEIVSRSFAQHPAARRHSGLLAAQLAVVEAWDVDEPQHLGALLDRAAGVPVECDEKRGDGPANALKCVCLFTIYDLEIMCALRKFFESSTCAGAFSRSVTMMNACCHDF